MIRFDSQLGWRLVANWSGAHRHHDYDVVYHINRSRFRGEAPEPHGGLTYAVLGDSFTFGQGVGDEQTFVHLMAAADERRHAFLNLGVPGYSTDQEYLLLEERVVDFELDVVVLVAYLGNDLFDNRLPFPLQGTQGKPLFRLDAGGLTLENSPVPRRSKPAAARGTSLSSIVAGDDRAPKRSSLRTRVGRWEVFRRLGLFQPRGPTSDEDFQRRFEPALKLFYALVDAMSVACERHGARLEVVLLPGRSFVTNPESVSAHYQDYLRGRIVGDLTAVSIIDVASMLRAAGGRSATEWYFPNDGHLTPLGHRVVADFLLERLDVGSDGTSVAPQPRGRNQGK